MLRVIFALIIFTAYESCAQNGYNIRFSCQYKPLSYIHLVYNHDGFGSFEHKKLTEDYTIAKLSYLKQF